MATKKGLSIICKCQNLANTSIYEKSPSFKVMAIAVWEFWRVELDLPRKHPLPSGNKVKEDDQFGDH